MSASDGGLVAFVSDRTESDFGERRFDGPTTVALARPSVAAARRMTAAEAIDVAVIGAGPAGLAAAEAASDEGARVVVFDWTPSPGRKFLMAGKSGLNITQDVAGSDVAHWDPGLDGVRGALTEGRRAERYAQFVAQFGAAANRLRPMLDAFPPEAVVAWCAGLGQSCFVGSGGRVFPTAMKASPLLRAWLARLEERGVEIRRRWRWTGFEEAGALTFETLDGPRGARPRATALAAGGASWPRLGADGSVAAALRAEGVLVAPFAPSNVGVEIDWSTVFRERFAGAPVKSTRFSVGATRRFGEAVASEYGLEGSAIYALGPAIRSALAEYGRATLTLDLAPERTMKALISAFQRQPRKASVAAKLRKAARIDGVKAALFREAHRDLHARLSAEMARDGDGARAMAEMLKAAPLTIERLRPIKEAISSAGGVAWEELDETLMLRRRPGCFCAGEMIDWDAPTGGYLISACLATGRWAGRGAARYAADRRAATSSERESPPDLL